MPNRHDLAWRGQRWRPCVHNYRGRLSTAERPRVRQLCGHLTTARAESLVTEAACATSAAGWLPRVVAGLVLCTGRAARF